MFMAHAIHRALRVAALSLAFAGLIGARAASLTVVNSDFETGGFATDAFSNNPGVIPSGWSAAGATTGLFFGYLNPNDAGYPGTTGANAVTGTMSGGNVFYFGSMVTGQGIQQTLSATFEADTDYELTVALGARIGNLANTASLDMRLLAGTTVIASGTVRNTANNGTFSDFNLVYAYTAADTELIGQHLVIQFLENDIVATGEVDIDNVRLTSVPVSVPEPSSVALAAGLAAAVVCARRRPQA